MIDIFKTKKGQCNCVMNKTNEFRWIEKNWGERELQQAKMCIYCGRIEWENVPTIREGEE